MSILGKNLRNDKGSKENIHVYIMLMITLLFYIFFIFYDGAVICVDSPSYINKDLSREPGYPIFLMLMQMIGRVIHVDYLFLAAVVQSLLAAIAAWTFAKFLMQKLNLPLWISYGVLALPMLVSLFCRFVAQRASMFSNSILTEGITISLYFLFIRYLYEYIVDETRSSLLWCLLYSFVLCATRKQMMITLMILMLGIFYVNAKKKKYVKAVLAMTCSAIVVLCASNFLDLGYNYIVRGEVTRHSSDTRFFTTVGFYVADRTDVQYIHEKELQTLFLSVYDTCDEQGYLGNSAGEGWLNRVSHFGEHYDHIQIDTMWPQIVEFAKGKVGEDVVAFNGYVDNIMNQYNIVLLHHIPEVTQVFLDNFVSGLVTTIAQRRSILIVYSVIMYLVYLALMVWHIFHRKEEGNSRILTLAAVTTISVIVNVGVVSLVIFTQTRYTIYNMALFYITLLIMGWNFMCNVKRRKKRAEGDL